LRHKVVHRDALLRADRGSRGVQKAKRIPQQHAANTVVPQVIYNSLAELGFPILDNFQAAIELVGLEPARRVEPGYASDGSRILCCNAAQRRSCDRLAEHDGFGYAELDHVAFERLMSADVSVAEALLCETLVARAIQCEWAINLGRRDALARGPSSARQNVA
jgi:hypothetical protein